MPQLDTLFTRAERRLQVGADAWLVHTYTRERRTGSYDDPLGNQAGWTYAPVEPGIPCYFKQVGLQGLDATGHPVIVSQITITIRPDDPLARGDKVSHITDRNRNVVEDGPLFVRWLQTTNSFGPMQSITAYMQEAEGNAA